MLGAEVRHPDAAVSEHVHDPSVHVRVGAEVLLEARIKLPKVHISDRPWSERARPRCLSRRQARSYLLPRERGTLDARWWWEAVLHADFVAHAVGKLIVPPEHAALL